MRLPKHVMPALVLLAFTINIEAADRPNILFIAVDDLRPELGCYGSPIAISPNLDALAGDGLLFNRAYCQQAICRPSRASLMTGARPETTGLFHNYVSLRELQPDIVTLPQHFIAHGYETVYCGKIFHNGDTDEENSWSRSPVKWIEGVKKPVGAYALPENNHIKNENMKRMLAKYGEAARRGLASGPAYESADVPDHAYEDGYNTRLAIATMKEMVGNADKPFFLALGFKKPHLNWTAPKKYWDLYDPENIPLATQVDAPQDGAAMGLHASFELRTRAGIPKIGPIDPRQARTLKHAYLACVSYVDAQIGLMIEALEEAGVRDNTIIIVWGDHGWHLGDMGVWGKATNYEIATRVPLMIWTPGMQQRGANRRARRTGRHVSDALRIGGTADARAFGGTQLCAPARPTGSAMEGSRLQPVPQSGTQGMGGEPAFARNARDLVRTTDQRSRRTDYRSARRQVGPRTVRATLDGIHDAYRPLSAGRLARPP